MTRALLVLLWRRMLASYWFVPALMILVALGLFALGLRLDPLLGEAALPGPLRWLDIERPSGASDLLGTVVGAIINVISIVFSLTIVTLTIVGSQYGSNVLRSAMDDNVTKFTLGTFTANFIFCLLTLSQVAGLDDEGRVPRLLVALALIATVFSMAVLIVFIHHIAQHIQVSNIVERLSLELLGALRSDYGPLLDGQVRGRREGRMSGPEGQAISAQEGGYVQAVGREGLLTLACRHDLRIHIGVRPGDFVVPGQALASVTPAADPAQEKAVRAAIVLGSVRTPAQDLRFSVEKLAELGVRALSPGINEPFVALTCINYLELFLTELVRRQPPPTRLEDTQGVVRLELRELAFRDILETAFNQLVHFSGNNADVMLGILNALRNVARLNLNPDYVSVLNQYRDMLADIVDTREWEAQRRDPLRRLCRPEEGEHH